MPSYSARQSDVVSLLHRGLSYKQIAAALGLAECSVKQYAFRARLRNHFVNNNQMVVAWEQDTSRGYRVRVD